MKKFSITFVALLFMVCTFLAPQTAAYTLPAEYVIHAKSAMLVSLDTGGILYSKDCDVSTYPASLQKIMVALIVLERETDFNRKITASDTAINSLLGTGAAIQNIKVGEELSVLDLLHCLLIPSACDAANVLAEYYGGSTENFVQIMNDRAAALGMVDTVYTNAHGLHDDQQVTTAQDMLILVQEALKYDLFLEICSKSRYTVEATNMSPQRILVSTNFMMDKTTSYYNKNVKGIKTGYTDPAGRCLISTAENDGARYLCIVMGCPLKDENGNNVRYEFADTQSLYTWAFNNLVTAQVVDPSRPIAEVKVEMAKQQDYMQLLPAEKLNAVIPKGAESSVIIEKHLNSETVNAPINKGDVLGYGIVKCAGEELGRVDLVAASSLERSSLLYSWSKIKAFFKNPIVIIIGCAILLFLIIAVTLNIIHNRRRRKMRRVKSYQRK